MIAVKKIVFASHWLRLTVPVVYMEPAQQLWWTVEAGCKLRTS